MGANDSGVRKIDSFQPINLGISQKRYKIGPWLLWMTNWKSRTKIIDLGLPRTLNRTLLQKRCIFRSPPQKFEWIYYYHRQKCTSMTLVSGNINYCRQSGVGWLKSPNLHFSRCYIFVSFRNTVDIIVHYDDTPFWISADTQFNLKCDFRAASLCLTFAVVNVKLLLKACNKQLQPNNTKIERSTNNNAVIH